MEVHVCRPRSASLGRAAPYSSSVFLTVDLDWGLPRAPAAPGRACPVVAKSSYGCPWSFMSRDETHTV